MRKSRDQQDNLDGFSSEEEIKPEEVDIEIRKETEVEETHREQVRLRLPSPQQIKKKSYSLNPDMATGWAPKSELPAPIPLLFDSRQTDSIVRRFQDKKNMKMQLVYLGPRYDTTYEAWLNKDFCFPYDHVAEPRRHNKFSGRPLYPLQHVEQNLRFDSSFQSGNLDCAIRVGQREYDLYIRVDSNTRGHLQWYNFKVEGLQKLQKYKFNICNFQKKTSLYARGQRPYILSKKKQQAEGKGWQQDGYSIRYECSPAKSSKVLTNNYRCYYKLSFEYYTEYEADHIQMAYCIPYLYSQLNQFLDDLAQKCAKRGILARSKLCTSLGGLEVPQVVVSEGKQADEDNGARVTKKCIVVCGRVHPGESNGSYMMEGFLNFICGESKEARTLRKDFIFKVVPMLNPDGVCLGNYRTGISGRDFNRMYHNPDRSIFPEVHAMKQLVVQAKKQYRDNMLMFLDLHGHSTKKNVFVYGPEFPIVQKYYYECRIFPKLLANHTQMFRYYSCSFRISECKVKTARAVFLRRLMIPLSYTVEASNGCFYNVDQLKDVNFSMSSWDEMGSKIGAAVAEYGDLVVSAQRQRNQKMKQRNKKKQGKMIKKNNSNPANLKEKVSIDYGCGLLSEFQDERMTCLLEQIQKVEAEREANKNEEDDISEGSSDGEGQGDDLAAQKMNALLSAIVNKKQSHQLSWHHNNNNNEQQSEQRHSQQHEKTQQSQKNQQIMKDQYWNGLLSSSQREQQEVVSFRPNSTQRGYLYRNKDTQTSYIRCERKDKIAARIINFSFIGERPRFDQQRHLQKNNTTDNSAVNSSKKSSKKDATGYNNCVLDLSGDGANRFAYVSMLRDKVLQKSPDIRASTFLSQGPRKVSMKLEEFKQRRSALQDYQK